MSSQEVYTRQCGNSLTENKVNKEGKIQIIAHEMLERTEWITYDDVLLMVCES